MNYETSDLIEKSATSYQPSMAIVVYEGEGGVDYYLESHDITDGVMGAGVPLSTECISDIASSFSALQSITPHGAIPDRLLYADSREGRKKYIWYNPPCMRQMFFAKQLNIKDGTYSIPGIVYVARGHSLCLYAFKGEKPEKELFKAPFFNTTDGCVCLGNARIEYPGNPSYGDLISYWEKKFWLTEFTHLGGAQNPTKNNLVSVTKKSKEKFDEGELLPMGITLNDLFK